MEILPVGWFYTSQGSRKCTKHPCVWAHTLQLKCFKSIHACLSKWETHAIIRKH